MNEFDWVGLFVLVLKDFELIVRVGFCGLVFYFVGGEFVDNLFLVV